MFSDIENLDQLAESVRKGETDAAARLREAMAPALQRILRRAARSGPDRAAYRLSSAVVERIAGGRMTRPMMIRETVLA